MQGCAGLEVEIARAVAKSVLGDDTKVRFVETSSSTRDAMFSQGAIDVALGSFTVTDERMAKYAFADSYYADMTRLFVQSGADYARLSDMCDSALKIVVRKTSSGYAALEQYVAEACPTTQPTVVPMDITYEQMVSEVSDGTYAASCLEHATLAPLVSENADKIKLLADLFGEQRYAPGMPASSLRLLKLVDDVMGRAAASGDIRAWTIGNGVTVFPDQHRISEVDVIRQRGALRVGTGFNAGGLSTCTESEGIVTCEGVEVDIARAIAQTVLGSEGQVVFVESSSATRDAQFANGDIDISVASFTTNAERRKLYAFADVYYTERTRIVVGSGATGNELAEMCASSTPICARASSSVLAGVEAEVRDACGEGAALTVSGVDGTYEELLAKVGSECGGLALEGIKAQALIKGKEDSYRLLDTAFGAQDYAPGMPLASTELLRLADDAMYTLAPELPAILEKHGVPTQAETTNESTDETTN